MTDESAPKPPSKRPQVYLLIALVAVAGAVWMIQGPRLMRALREDNPGPWKPPAEVVAAEPVEGAAELAAVPEQGGEFSQFQGPGRNGVVAGAIAERFPESGPKVLWRAEVSPGFGGAALRGGQAFLLERIEDAADVLRVFDLETGALAYELRSECPGRTGYNGSRSVPTVTATRAFGLGQIGLLTAFDLEARAIAWTVNLPAEHGASPPGFGFAASPLVAGGLVIVPVQSRDCGLIAFKAESGELAWRSPGVGGNSFVSPLLVTIADTPQVIYHAQGALVGVDPATGEELWRDSAHPTNTPIAAVTPFADGRMFLTCGYNVGSAMLRVTRGEAGWSVGELWRIEADGSHIHPGLPFGEELYVNFNRNANLSRRATPARLVCLSIKDGTERWRTADAPHIDRGPLLRVGERLLSLGGDDGILRIIAPDPAGYKELAAGPLFTELKRRDNQIWAPLALADGILVARSQRELVAVDLRP